MRNILNDEVQADVEVVEGLFRELGRQRSLRDPIASALEEMQFTPAQLHTLLWLGMDGELTMGDLARRVGITEKTITGVVDRLERESFVARDRDEVDRRVVMVKLTRKGVVRYRKLEESLHLKVTRILSLLDPEDRQALKQILHKLLERMQRPRTPRHSVQAGHP